MRFAVIVMPWLSASAAPVEHASDVYVLAVGGDPHLDYEWRSTGGNILGRFFNVGGGGIGLPRSMQADAYLLLGDIVSDRQVDVNGDRVVDCSVDRTWTDTCEFPSPWSGQMVIDTYAMYGGGRPFWGITGNHDGNPPVATIAGIDEPNEWWRTYVAPLMVAGVVHSESAHVEVQVQMPGGIWTILLVNDWDWAEDRGRGGKCDLRDWSVPVYAHCSTKGWPNGTITTEQLMWLESAIARAEAAGRHVLVATHQPPPYTTVLTGAPGEAYAEVCPGVRVQQPSLEAHFPRDVDILPLRADLDGAGNPREIAHDWASSLLRWEGGAQPDTDWAVELVQRHPGVVRVWVSGHNHIPVPDLEYGGRGVRYDDPVSGTTWLAHGALTTGWCTTAGFCRQQAARLELHADGSWTWERWAVQGGTVQLPAACWTEASLPAVRPGPWDGLPIEIGAAWTGGSP